MKLFIAIVAVSFYSFKTIKSATLDSTQNEKMYTVEVIPNTFADIGKGPHWDPSTYSLYYTDIYGPTLYRYDYNGNNVYKCKIENETISTVIIPIEDQKDKYAVAMGRKLNVIEWDGFVSTCKVSSTLFEVEEDLPDNRFNDCKADPKGRFVGGTTHQENNIFAKRQSHLFRWTSGQVKPDIIKDKVGVSNGLTWNLKKKNFYYIDSIDLEVKEYDYDIKTGDIKNKKVLYNFRINDEKLNFVPDSMAIDTNGFLYVALFGGGKVVKINPESGNIELEIIIPAELITSCTFGGPNMDILFVTTAGRGNKTKPAGQTFKVTGLGVQGEPTYKLKI